MQRKPSSMTWRPLSSGPVLASVGALFGPRGRASCGKLWPAKPKRAGSHCRTPTYLYAPTTAVFCKLAPLSVSFAVAWRTPIFFWLPTRQAVAGASRNSITYPSRLDTIFRDVLLEAQSLPSLAAYGATRCGGSQWRRWLAPGEQEQQRSRPLQFALRQERKPKLPCCQQPWSWTLFQSSRCLQGEGSEQGDALAAALCALAVHDALQAAAEFVAAWRRAFPGRRGLAPFSMRSPSLTPLALQLFMRGRMTRPFFFKRVVRTVLGSPRAEGTEWDRVRALASVSVRDGGSGSSESSGGWLPASKSAHPGQIPQARRARPPLQSAIDSALGERR